MNQSTNPAFIYTPTNWQRFKFTYISNFLDSIFFNGKSKTIKAIFYIIYGVGIPLGVILCFFPFIPWILKFLFIFSVSLNFIIPAIRTKYRKQVNTNPTFVLTIDPISEQQQEKIQSQYHLDNNAHFYVLTNYRYDFFVETSKNLILCGYVRNKNNKAILKVVFFISKKENLDSIHKSDFVKRLKPFCKKYIKL